MQPMQNDKTKYLSIHALTQYIKHKFDKDPYLGKVFIEGEVSNFRERPNNHQYFSLKDDHAKISVVMFRSKFAKVPFKLEEGMKVFATGTVTVYERGGNYQIILDSIEPDGVGALYQALEQLKKKMHEQGLFEKLQRPLVRLPKRIAVITSPTGSVIRDILTTIQRRFPIVQVTVFPTRVQGQEAVAEIVNAFNQVELEHDRFDTIILARGGGSIEDLWCFNDEKVAEAILKSSVPVISSVGHETDTTIADLVADVRAATPTAAAELAVPVLTDVLRTISQLQDRLTYAMTQRLNFLRKQYSSVSRTYVLEQPERLYQAYVQQLDYTKERLLNTQTQYFEQKNYGLKYLQQGLLNQEPTAAIESMKKENQQLTHQLTQSFKYLLESQQKQIQSYTQLLDAHSPLKILSRGYALVESDKQVISKIEHVDIDQEIEIHLSDGTVSAIVHDKAKHNHSLNDEKGSND